MKNVKLQPSLLKSCAPAMSTEETRYYLKGVHVFERDGNIIYEATNGYFLIRCTATLEQDEDLSGLDIIIPDFFVKEISKPSFLRGFGCIGIEYVDAVIDGQTISIEMPDGVASNKLIDGTFPNLDQVFPEKKIGVNALDVLGFNLNYLGKLSVSAKAFDGTFTSQVSASANDSPFYFKKIGERGVWEAVLMPVRV